LRAGQPTDQLPLLHITQGEVFLYLCGMYVQITKSGQTGPSR
jgi:hypothetical protein